MRDTAAGAASPILPDGADGAPDARILRLRDVATVLLRGAPFALLVTVVAVAAAVLVTRAQDPVFRASVALVAAQDAPRFGDADVVVPPVVDAGVYRTAIYEGGVLRAALEEVDGRVLGERAYLRASEAVRVRIESQPQSSVVRIDVTDGSPTRAATLAGSIADGLVAWDRDRARRGLEAGVTALERAVAAIDQELEANGALDAGRAATLQALRAERLDDLAAARDAAAGAVAVARIQPLAPPLVPEEPVGPRLVLNATIALVLGLVAGYGILLAVWTTNPRVGGREDLARFGGVPVLAELRRRDRRNGRVSEEAVGWLRTRLAARGGARDLRVVAVAGLQASGDADGVAVALAESFARSGARTLLVDANLREASATTGLGVVDARGAPYGDAAGNGGARSQGPVSVVVDRDRAFDFVPASRGASNPVERLVRAFRDNIVAWRDGYDVVVVDAAPVLAGADAAAVAAFVDGVVVCARRGRATRGAVHEALRLLAEQKGVVLGTVLTSGPARAGRRLERPATRGAAAPTGPVASRRG